MHRKRKGAPSRRALAMRIQEERRGLLARLASWERRSPVRDGRRLTGENTPVSEFVEAAQEDTAQVIAVASRKVLISRLTALDRADAKIREGTYGRCDLCGRPIPAARLRALPEAVRCVPCADLRPGAPLLPQSRGSHAVIPRAGSASRHEPDCVRRWKARQLRRSLWRKTS